MQVKPVLYLGDTSLATAAAYLGGLLHHYRFEFDYVASDQPLGSQAVGIRRLFILSDYPAARVPEEVQQQIAQQVEQGAGLLKIGGWESFCGESGRWAGTTIAGVLPVHISEHDDRVNCDQPTLLRCVREHPTTAGLPWDQHPPGIGGFNRFSARDDATVLLEAERFHALLAGTQVAFEPIDRNPMLVVGQHGRGRTGALATDLAPHWVGGLVDWGRGRVSAQAPESWPIEVGEYYAQFVHNLIAWAAGLDAPAKGTVSVQTSISASAGRRPRRAAASP